MAEKVSEWRNTTSGHLGVVKHDEEGKPRGISVKPGGTVLLTEKDRVATANAPANAANNPFQNGALVCITAETELSHRRPIGDASQSAPDPQPEPEPAPPEPEGETGAAAPPEGDPPTGQAAPHEEVAAEPSAPAVQIEDVSAAQPAPEPVPVTQEPQGEPTPPPAPTPTPTPTPRQ